MQFSTTLDLHGKTATGITVPEDVVAGLKAGRRVPVLVTIKGYTYRSTVAVYGGEYMLPVSADVREKAGIAAGDVLDVRLEVDTEPRVADVPEDLRAALAADPAAQSFFDPLSFSHKKAYIAWIDEAKKADTRANRISKAIEMLRAGQKR